MNHRRRLAILESCYRVGPDVCAIAERMAEEDGDVYTADELLSSAEEVLRVIGPPATADRYAAYVERVEGIPAAELVAAAKRRMEESG